MSGMNTPSHPLLVESFPAQQRSLRLAVVTETYPPEVNGVALTVDRLVRGLQARNHDLQLIRPRQTADHGDAQDSLEQVLMRGLPIPRYPHLRMGMPAKKALLKLWSVRRPDVVHVATEGPLGWSALQAARKLRLPVSTDFRTNFHAYSRHYGVGWLQKPVAAYLRKFHNLAHCTMVPTPALRDELDAMGFQRLLVVARGVDTQRFMPALRSDALRAQWGVRPDELVVLSVGRLAAEKNLGLLIEAFRAMQQVYPRCRLVVVGDGPERVAFERSCPEALCVGSQTGQALADHYANADIFLFSSLTETYGNVVPEAMASGLAVLAFDCAAAAELIQHGQNGWLAPVGDADAFVRRAQDLVAHPQGLTAVRQAAREAVLTLDWGCIVSQVEQVWHHLLCLGSASSDTTALAADGQRLFPVL